MSQNSIFIAGIGTDVGKTIVSSILCNALDWDYWKPIQTGPTIDHDRNFVSQCQNNHNFQIFEESYIFKNPLSPHIAAKKEGTIIDLKTIKIPSSNRNLIVEGAGGIMVPIDYAGNTNLDLIKKLDLEVIVVSRHYLGSINHTLLTIEKLKSENIQILGLIYVGDEIIGTKEIIELNTGIKTIIDIPWFFNPIVDKIKDFCTKNKTLIQKNILGGLQ